MSPLLTALNTSNLIDATLPAAATAATAKSGYLYGATITDSCYTVAGVRSNEGAGFRDFVIREDGVVYAGTTVTGLTIGSNASTAACATPAGATPIGVAAAS